MTKTVATSNIVIRTPITVSQFLPIRASSASAKTAIATCGPKRSNRCSRCRSRASREIRDSARLHSAEQEAPPGEKKNGSPVPKRHQNEIGIFGSPGSGLEGSFTLAYGSETYPAAERIRVFLRSHWRASTGRQYVIHING